MKRLRLISILGFTLLFFNNSFSQNIFPDSGFVGIGVLNPQFELDVNGNVRISNNLYVGGGIIISEKVNATKELKSATLKADSIIMDSTKAFYGESRFADSVKIQSKLRVDGNIDVGGDLRSSGSIVFGGDRNISYIPHQNGITGDLCFGTRLPAYTQCNPLVQQSNQNWFGGRINIWGNPTWDPALPSSVLKLGSDGSNGIIEIEGTNAGGGEAGLLINYYCGRNVVVGGRGNDDPQNPGPETGTFTTRYDTYLAERKGSVGIGTNIPSEKLTVSNGNILIKGTNNFTSTNDEATLFLGDNNHYIKGINGGGLRIGTYQSPDAIMLMQSNGNVGIGTITPFAKLSIEGNSDNNTIVSILDTRNPSQNSAYNIFQIQKLYPDDIIGNPPVRGTFFSITDTGNVSVGVSVHNHQPTPVQRLEVWGAIKLSAAATTSPSAGTIEFTSGKFYGYTSNGIRKSLGGQWNESTLDPNNIYYSSGNVGIGIINPNASLHVNNSLYVEGSIPMIKIMKTASSGVEANIGFTGFNDDFFINNIPANFLINTGGNIGVGAIPALNYPSEKLEVCNGYNFSLMAPTWNSEDAGDIIFKKSDGTVKARIWSNNSISKGLFLNGGNLIGTNPVADLIIDETGKVGIGTTQLDANSILTVNGKIIAEEIEVVQQVLPDYVFEKDYKLMTLNELEKYLLMHKHLPEIPSAEYVKNNGLQLGEFSTLLLKKVEELTLYLIQIEKDNIALKERIYKLENK